MKNIPSEIERLAGEAQHTVISSANKILIPARKTLLKRFPLTSVLLVVFGVTATTYGAELFFSRIPYVVEHPLHLFFAGLLSLLCIGKLYQKLG